MTISDTACFISTRVTVPNTLVTPMKVRTTTLQVNQVFDFIQLFMAALLNKTNATGLVVVGYMIPAIGLWWMIFKPF